MKNSNKIIYSLIFVLIIAFCTNYFFVSRIQANQDRGVASFGERSSIHQIKWEQKLAKDISSGKMRMQMPTQVSWQDVLVYEYLRGQYNVSLQDGYIEKITVQNADAGLVIDVNQFMSEYGKKIKNYSSYEVKNLNKQTDVVELRDEQGSSAGEFQFNKDSDGRVTSINIQ
ncbi:MAG: hypothetical protein ACK41T_12070 [Pseudobdellovibrio sp.]